MPTDIEKGRTVGPNFIMNGSTLYKMYIQKIPLHGWKTQMESKHEQFCKEAVELNLKYIAGDLQPTLGKNCSIWSNSNTDFPVNHQSNLCWLDQLNELAITKMGSRQLVDDDYVLKYIVALNALEKDITNAAQLVLKELEMKIYAELKDKYSFGFTADKCNVFGDNMSYNHISCLSSKYEYCCFLLNFVLKRMLTSLDCNDSFKEQVMSHAMKHRFLTTYFGSSKFEDTFLSRIYNEAKRRVKQTPANHLKRHRRNWTLFWNTIIANTCLSPLYICMRVWRSRQLMIMKERLWL